jgi:phage tail protein X
MKKYLVSQGDVWDLISFKIYGDESFMDVLLDANPDLRHIVIFTEPAYINVPERPVVARSLADMPPWKQ